MKAISADRRSRGGRRASDRSPAPTRSASATTCSTSSVVAVRDALVDAVRSGRLPEERLVDAAGARRSARIVGVGARRAPRRPGCRPDRRAACAAARGRVRARRARRSSSSSCPRSAWRPVVCRSFPASGSRRWCRTPRSAASSEGRFDSELDLDGRQLVVIARDAHRHEWERDADRGADGANARCDRDRDRPPALAPAERGDLCRDARSRPRQRGSCSRGAILRGRDAGWSSLVARRAHNPEVAGSNPAPATGKAPETGLFCSLDRDQPAELLPNFCLGGCDVSAIARVMRVLQARVRSHTRELCCWSD